MIKRYIESDIQTHLNSLRQIVFLTGPRQVGKTTLVKKLLGDKFQSNYYNWDDPHDRKELLTNIFKGNYKFKNEIYAFDEIHKFNRWKNTLKGLFDKNEPNTHWIITGSGKLNIFRKGEDSLLGRQFTYQLYPLSVAELLKTSNVSRSITSESLFKPAYNPNTESIYNRLLNFSGFPEPYLKEDKSFLSKWRVERNSRLINQDLADIENLKNLPLVEHLSLLLPERVGTPLSINNLREDLNVHFTTVKHWIELLERVHFGFRISPYSSSLTRLLKKETKWYLLDWTDIENEGYRHENLIAVHLKKFINYLNDTGKENLELTYIRDKEKREVDFLILKKRKPYLLIEAKLSENKISKDLIYYADKLKVKKVIQLVSNLDKEYTKEVNNIEVDVLKTNNFLQRLV